MIQTHLNQHLHSIVSKKHANAHLTVKINVNFLQDMQRDQVIVVLWSKIRSFLVISGMMNMILSIIHLDVYQLRLSYSMINQQMEFLVFNSIKDCLLINRHPFLNPCMINKKYSPKIFLYVWEWTVDIFKQEVSIQINFYLL